LSENE
jgi:hypothetical protein